MLKTSTKFPISLEFEAERKSSAHENKGTSDVLIFKKDESYIRLNSLP